MNLLVTGAFGYLGGRLSQYLAVNTDYKIVLGSRSHRKSPVWLPQMEVVHTQWESPQQLAKICSGLAAIIHVAGMNAYDCVQDPALALECNGLSTARLLQAAVLEKVKRFIYVSTAHVYANPLIGKITEESCLKNIHPYASSHRAGEDAIRAAHHRGDIEGIVIRLSNAYGAPMRTDMNCWMLFVNDICRQAVQTQKIQLNSSGQQQRDFINLTDACRAINHLFALPAGNLKDGVFNLGGASSLTVLEMANLVSQRFENITGRKVEISTNGMDEKNAEVLDYDISKLMSTGFQLSDKKTALDEIDTLIGFCLEHFH